MTREDKFYMFYMFILIATIITILAIAFALNHQHNTTPHSSDVTVTEWVSPDGVHYWYQQSGAHAMLAPRYDSNGNLVTDKQ